MEKLEYLDDLTSNELRSINGGSAATIVGLGIAQGVGLMIGGIYGWAWTTYNYFKD